MVRVVGPGVSGWVAWRLVTWSETQLSFGTLSGLKKNSTIRSFIHPFTYALWEACHGLVAGDRVVTDSSLCSRVGEERRGSGPRSLGGPVRSAPQRWPSMDPLEYPFPLRAASFQI